MGGLDRGVAPPTTGGGSDFRAAASRSTGLAARDGASGAPEISRPTRPWRQFSIIAPINGAGWAPSREPVPVNLHCRQLCVVRADANFVATSLIMAKTGYGNVRASFRTWSAGCD